MITIFHKIKAYTNIFILLLICHNLNEITIVNEKCKNIIFWWRSILEFKQIVRRLTDFVLYDTFIINLLINDIIHNRLMCFVFVIINSLRLGLVVRLIKVRYSHHHSLFHWQWTNNLLLRYLFNLPFQSWIYLFWRYQHLQWNLAHIVILIH